MATNPPPPRPAPGSAGAQLISLFESLPSLIAQVRAGKLNHHTVIQLRLIIPKHRKQAAEYLVRKGLPDPFVNLPDTLDPDKPLPASWSKYVEEVNRNMGIKQGNGNKPPAPDGGSGPGSGPGLGGSGGAGGAGGSGGSGAAGGQASATGGDSNTGAQGSNATTTDSASGPTNPPQLVPSNQAASMAARPGPSAPPPQVSSLPMGTARPPPMNIPNGSPAGMRPRPQPRLQGQTPRPPQQNQARPPQSQPRPPGQLQARPPPQTQVRPPGPNQQPPQAVNQPRPPQGIPAPQMAGGAKVPVSRSRTTSEAPSQGGGKKPNAMAPGNKYTWAEVFKFPEEERNAWFAEEPKAKPAWDNIMAQVQLNRQKESASNSRSASPAPDPAAVRPPHMQMVGGMPPAPGTGVRPPGAPMQSGLIGQAVAPGPATNSGPLNAGPGVGPVVRPMVHMNTSLPNPSTLPNQMSNSSAPPPSTGPRPQQPGLITATANQNPNTAAADILAKNPPPAINLNLPINRVAPLNDNKQKTQETTATGPSGAAPGKWGWLRNCNPKPPSVKPAMLTDKNIDWYMTVNEKQFPTLTPEQQQMHQWIWSHVKKKRQAEQQQQQQRQQVNQPKQPNQSNQAQGLSGPQGPGNKTRPAPNPNPAPKQMSKEDLAAQISRLKEGGKQITMESIKELCRSTETPWTAELEKHLEPFCVPARPIKTNRQIFSEGLHGLAVQVTGEDIDEAMEKFFMGLAEDLYSDNVRGACFAAQARNKDDTSVSIKDMAFHMRHKHDRITAGYGPEVVIAGIKRKQLLGYKPQAVKRIRDTQEAQQS